MLRAGTERRAHAHTLSHLSHLSHTSTLSHYHTHYTHYHTTHTITHTKVAHNEAPTVASPLVLYYYLFNQ
jgi:hypothetical protein